MKELELPSFPGEYDISRRIGQGIKMKPMMLNNRGSNAEKMVPKMLTAGDTEQHFKGNSYERKFLRYEKR